jgi:hypothetical protein
MIYTQEFLRKNLRVGQIWVDKFGVEICIEQIMVDDKELVIGERKIVKFDYSLIHDHKNNTYDDIETNRALISDLDRLSYTGKYLYNNWKIDDITGMVDKIKESLGE